MIVDDSGMMRKHLGIILERAGHTIIAEATNGAQALLEYGNNQPDLVTMDLTMPTMNGIDAIKKIIFEYPKAKIIVISSMGQKHRIFEAIQCGAMHYIIKPFRNEKVLSVVELVLSAKPKI